MLKVESVNMIISPGWSNGLWTFYIVYVFINSSYSNLKVFDSTNNKVRFLKICMSLENVNKSSELL